MCLERFCSNQLEGFEQLSVADCKQDLTEPQSEKRKCLRFKPIVNWRLRAKSNRSPVSKLFGIRCWEGYELTSHFAGVSMLLLQPKNQQLNYRSWSVNLNKTAGYQRDIFRSLTLLKDAFWSMKALFLESNSLTFRNFEISDFFANLTLGGKDHLKNNITWYKF